MNLPQDPYILLSYVNTMLRDKYPSLEELCKVYQIESSQIEAVLSSIEYSYDKDKNRFAPMI